MLGIGKRSYWKQVHPVGAIADFREVFRDAGGNRWRIALASLAVTGTMFWTLTHESWRVRPPRPTVIYVNSFPLDRTAAESREFMAKNQKVVDQIKAEDARQAQIEKDMYKALGRASGMDVDAIERKALQEQRAADAKASEAAKVAAQKQLEQQAQNQVQNQPLPQAPVGKR